MQKVVFVLLLIFSALAPLAVSQSVMSQTYLTFNSTQYSTGTTAITYYSTTSFSNTSAKPVVYVHMPYYFIREKSSFTLGEEKDMKQVRSNVTQELPCLYYDYFVFNANASQEIRAHFTASDAVGFYVMDINQLSVFNRTTCGYGYIPSITGTVAPSYDLDWMVPHNGQYAFLFATERYDGAYITIYFTANAFSTVMQSATATYTTSSTYVIQNFQTTIIPNPTGVSPTPNSSGSTYLTAGVTILVIVMGLVALSVIVKRRGLLQSST
jgi:hypothetical protein